MQNKNKPKWHLNEKILNVGNWSWTAVKGKVFFSQIILQPLASDCHNMNSCLFLSLSSLSFGFCVSQPSPTSPATTGRSTSAPPERNTTTTAGRRCPSGRSPKSGWRGSRGDGCTALLRVPSITHGCRLTRVALCSAGNRGKRRQQRAPLSTASPRTGTTEGRPCKPRQPPASPDPVSTASGSATPSFRSFICLHHRCFVLCRLCWRRFASAAQRVMYSDCDSRKNCWFFLIFIANTLPPLSNPRCLVSRFLKMTGPISNQAVCYVSPLGCFLIQSELLV